MVQYCVSMRPLEVNKNIFQNYERNRSDSGYSGECLEKEMRELHRNPSVLVAESQP